MDQNTKFKVDECVLVPLIREQFGMFATRVPWLGTPPPGHDSWQDEDITDKIREGDYVFVTNNRRDFVNKHYPERLDIHNGLIVLLERSDLAGDIFMMREVMDFLKYHDDIINNLLEVTADGSIKVYDWPDCTLQNPWGDPARRK